MRSAFDNRASSGRSRRATRIWEMPVDRSGAAEQGGTMESTTADEHDHLNSTLRSDSTMDEHSGPKATARAFYATVDAISADGRPIVALEDITIDDFVVHLPGADAANRDGSKAIVTSFRRTSSVRVGVATFGGALRRG
jgi:hypothetical protein